MRASFLILELNRLFAQPKPRADHIKHVETLAKQGWQRESLDGVNSVLQAGATTLRANEAFASSFATPQMTFGVNPLPQILPALLIERKKRAGCNPDGCHPDINSSLHPVRNRGGSYVAALADKIGDDPMLLSLLYVAFLLYVAQCSQFRSAETATQQMANEA